MSLNRVKIFRHNLPSLAKAYELSRADLTGLPERREINKFVTGSPIIKISPARFIRSN